MCKALAKNNSPRSPADQKGVGACRMANREEGIGEKNLNGGMSEWGFSRVYSFYRCQRCAAFQRKVDDERVARGKGEGIV